MGAGTWALVGALAGAVLGSEGQRAESAAVGAAFGAACWAHAHGKAQPRRVVDAQARVVSP